jgi:hypothetical protein
MEIEGYIDYQRREYCKDISCPVQVLMDSESESSPKLQTIRSICTSSCIHSTYEFHHWLIQKGYLVVRPAEGSKS